MKKLLLIVIVSITLVACAHRPLSAPNNLCTIFEDHPEWYRASKKAAERWSGNIHVPMAIMYQESRFEARAQPPMRYFLGFIPYGRASNAFGYAQALESTWANYQKAIGSRFKLRTSFKASVDFIQWYMEQSTRLNDIPKHDAYRQYLNYHEGQGGFSRGTFRDKSWLINAAERVEQRAQRYSVQLKECLPRLERKRKWLI